jgi:hypothetical protein
VLVDAIILLHCTYFHLNERNFTVKKRRKCAIKPNKYFAFYLVFY